MTTYFVGPGGADANNGTSWATRKLTLNGVEDVPITAGSTVYVAPGVYRETLTCDVSGSSGSPITYIGDVTGEHTDGVGGVVRITGSDDDQTATRTNSITATSKNYRTFRGFSFDTTTSTICTLTSPQNWVIEDCLFETPAARVPHIGITGAGQAACTIRRCWFWGGGNALDISHSATLNDTGHVVENCLFLVQRDRAVAVTRVGGITVRNCDLIGVQSNAVQVVTALAAGQTLTVQNSLLYRNPAGCVATTVGELAEDYNTFWQNSTDRTNVTTGTHSVAYPPLFQMPRLLSGLVLPWQPFALSEWSPVRALADSGAASDDLYGRARPATSGKRSWGAISAPDISRSSTQAHSGSYSLKLADAGRVQWVVPTTNVSTTFSVYVYREADYAGTAPQLIVKQPGQSDTTVTDAAAAGQWNQLSTALTPAASPGYVVVEIVSNNTASGNVAVYVDDLAVG